jgi:hypothetical protein
MRWLGRATRWCVIEHSIRFELHEPLWIDKANDLHDSVRRTNIAKELSVYRCDYLPMLDVR